MNKVYNSQQLNKKSGACQKLTELTGFTHMKHVLITDTKTGVSGVTSNAQLFDDHIFIAMLATKEKGKCRKTFWSTDFISPSMISMVLICRLPIMPLAQHRNLRYLRCQSGRSASRTVKLWVRSPKYLCYFTSFSPDTTSRLDVYRNENTIPYMLWGWAGHNSFSSSENNPKKKKTKGEGTFS